MFLSVPHLPVTPEQIATSATEAAEAGAAILMGRHGTRFEHECDDVGECPSN